MEQRLTEYHIVQFERYLRSEERAQGTIEKYIRDVWAFFRFCGEKIITKECVTAWKAHLIQTGYAPVTINSMLAALHGLFEYLSWHDVQVKYLKVQRRLFRDASKTLEKEDYLHLMEVAVKRGLCRIALLMETICATGIRVSEVKYITVEALRCGKAEIALKGKIRTILIPAKLANKLKKYARKNKIVSGEIFLTRNGKSMSRCQIWAEMKALCRWAGVDPSKVFPHNLRHLFARSYYKASRDIARLADILGHSSIETTRIYLITTGIEQTHQLAKLGLIL